MTHLFIARWLNLRRYLGVVYLIITCALLSINWSVAERCFFFFFFMECDDKEDIGPHGTTRIISVSTEAHELYLYLSYGCLRREILILQLCRRWITHSHIFFFLIPIRPGQQQRCPRARAFNTLFLRISFSVTHSLPRVHLLNLAYSFRLFSCFFHLRFPLFSLSPRSLHLACIRCNSVTWVEYRFQSLSQSF